MIGWPLVGLYVSEAWPSWKPSPYTTRPGIRPAASGSVGSVSTFCPDVGSYGMIVPVSPNFGTEIEALWIVTSFWWLPPAGS